MLPEPVPGGRKMGWPSRVAMPSDHRPRSGLVISRRAGDQRVICSAGAAVDILGLGFAARAGRLYEAAAAAKAAGAGQHWWIRWPANLEAFRLRMKAGAFWFSGMMIDINSLMWDDYGSLNDIFGTGIFPALC